MLAVDTPWESGAQTSAGSTTTPAEEGPPAQRPTRGGHRRALGQLPFQLGDQRPAFRKRHPPDEHGEGRLCGHQGAVQGAAPLGPKAEASCRQWFPPTPQLLLRAFLASFGAKIFAPVTGEKTPLPSPASRPLGGCTRICTAKFLLAAVQLPPPRLRTVKQ